MRDYFLRQLGVGEVWQLRMPTPLAPELRIEAPASANDVKSAVATQLERHSASQEADVVLIYRHPDAADAALFHDSQRLFVQILAALSFNQTLKLQTFDLAEMDRNQVFSAAQALQPRVILVLGAMDACNLLSLDSATDSAVLRQGNHCLQDIPVIVTHELSALLHQPALKRALWMDLCRVKGMFVH